MPDEMDNLYSILSPISGLDIDLKQHRLILKHYNTQFQCILHTTMHIIHQHICSWKLALRSQNSDNFKSFFHELWDWDEMKFSTLHGMVY